MGNRTLVATGAVGAILAVVCCAAPALVPTLVALGLAGAAGRFGGALITAVVVFAALAGYLIYRRFHMPARAAHNEGTEPDDR